MDTESQSPPASPNIILPTGRADLEDLQQKDVDSLPAETPGDWHIEMRYLPIAHRGHAFLALVDPDGRVQRELHGLSRSRNTGKVVAIGIDGAHLVGVQSTRPLFDADDKPANTVSLDLLEATAFGQGQVESTRVAVSS